MQELEKLTFPKILDDRGNLSFIEDFVHIPFKIRRVYWIYDVPGEEIRGGHAYKKVEEVIIALSGSFQVVITDTSGNKKSIALNKSYEGLYLPQLTWRYLNSFSTNSVGLILSSRPFEENDYIRDFDKFRSLFHEFDL